MSDEVAIAPHAADIARLYEAARLAQQRAEEAARRTAHLQRLTAALADATTEDEVVETVMHYGVLPVGAYAGAIAREVATVGPADASAECEIELRTSVGYPAEACMSVGRRWPRSVNIPLAEAIRTDEGVFVGSPQAWAERYGGGYVPSKSATPSRSQAWAALPIGGVEGRRAALLWTFDAPRDFTSDDQRLMAAVSQQCGQALERARLLLAERSARAEAEAGRAAAERAQREAEEANRAKSEFLARMSHDLRTPLNAIGGYAQLVQLGVHGPVSAAQQEALGRIVRAKEHLLTLINDILGFARLEAGQVQLQLGAVPLAEVLHELRILVEPVAAAKGLTLTVERPALPLTARADRDRLLQVLVNLASNAVKFTEQGSIVIRAAAMADQVQIVVQDTGRGIAEHRLEAIFDPFVQGAGEYPGDARGGVGLGLAIGRELARLMGGRLDVASVEGSGATFTLALPRVRDAEHAVVPTEREERERTLS